MAVGNVTNMVIRPDFFREGMIETIDQQVQVFNAASANALTFSTLALAGDFAKTSFIKRLTNVIQSRDDESDDPVDSTVLNQEDDVAVKIKRRIGPFEQTRDAFISAGMSPEELSFFLGNQVGEEALKDYMDSILLALYGATLNDEAENHVDGTGAVISPSVLIDGMRRFGDGWNRIAAIVMHSKPFFDYMDDAVTEGQTDLQFAAVFNAQVGTFNKPVIVTDSDSLVVDGEPDTYRTWLLQSQAGNVTESVTPYITDEEVFGSENLKIRIQGEHAFNLDVLGYSYNEGAGKNPSDAALAASGSWASLFSNIKDRAGIMIETQ